MCNTRCAYYLIVTGNINYIQRRHSHTHPQSSLSWKIGVIIFIAKQILKYLKQIQSSIMMHRSGSGALRLANTPTPSFKTPNKSILDEIVRTPKPQSRSFRIRPKLLSEEGVRMIKNVMQFRNLQNMREAFHAIFKQSQCPQLERVNVTTSRSRSRLHSSRKFTKTYESDYESQQPVILNQYSRTLITSAYSTQLCSTLTPQRSQAAGVVLSKPNLPPKYPNSLLSLLKKKFMLRKSDIFNTLKFNSWHKRKMHELQLRKIQSLRNCMRIQSRRLKTQLFARLLAVSYSSVSKDSQILKKQEGVLKSKSKVPLYRMICKTLRRRLTDGMQSIKLKAKKMALISKVEGRLNKIIQRFNTDGSIEFFRKLRLSFKIFQQKLKSVRLGSDIILRLDNRRLGIALDRIKQTKVHSIIKLHVGRNMCNVLHRLYTKTLASSKQKILSCAQQKNLEAKRIQAEQVANDLEEASEDLKVKEVLSRTEKLLRKEEIENRLLVQKLVQYDRTIRDLRKELRYAKIDISKLDREVKDKEVVISKLTLQNRKSQEITAKVREEMHNLMISRNYPCDCVRKIQRELADLHEIDQTLKELAENCTAPVSSTSMRNEESEDYQPNYFNDLYENQKRQNSMFQKVIDIMMTTLQTITQNNLVFKNQYGYCTSIAASLDQIKVGMNDICSKALTQITVEDYLSYARKCMQGAEGSVSELFNNLMGSFAVQEGSEFKLIKSKSIQLAKNGESVKKEFLKTADRNLLLRNSASKLDTYEQELKVYISKLNFRISDQGILGSHSDMEASPKPGEPFDQSEDLRSSRMVRTSQYINGDGNGAEDVDFGLVKTLFVELFRQGTSYNQRLLVKGKLIKLLGLSDNDQEAIGVRC